MQQRVARDNVHREIRRVGEVLHAACMERGNAQAEPSDCGGERIQIDAGDLVENAGRALARIRARLMLRPEAVQPPEGTEQKVSRTAGRIDEAHLAETKLLDRGSERAVEDEFLDELGCLEQRVLLAGAL